MVVRAAEESEAVGEDLERPLSEHQAIELHPFFQDPEHEVVLLDPRQVADLLLPRQVDQFLHRHLLQGGDVGVGLFQRLVPVGRIFPLEPDFLGDLLGDRHRLVVVGGGVRHGHGTPQGGPGAAPRESRRAR